MEYDLSEFHLVSNQSGIATLKLSNNALVFSRTIVYRLKNPRYIQILVQSDRRLIAIRPCQQEDAESIPFSNKPVAGIVQLRRKGIYRELSKLIIGFDPDSSETINIDGEYDDEEKLYIFNAREFYTDRPEKYLPYTDNGLPGDQSSSIQALL